ncbi:hypothetical protein [Bradyrhizobium sp. WSM471]|uniref:hypothetical protein n=1 Tax=Bradyrhizobium sp. WSM471 TaxID=319017 RepID=UPI00024D1A0B|nr:MULTISPECIES: hypothetical protein [Bradyrhizobium]EHR00180.1 hypothetical protein Bra471DRAFT_00724 [Bradyrhizobium sp. WSM471]UFW42301.1 hypothetical protein BcanWSM471_03575 [Bradyrhizobium canariense]
MAKNLVYRAIGQNGMIIPTPLYADDSLLAEIVLGEKASRWTEVRRAFERDGLPAPRASVCHLYYVPAVLRFLDRRESIGSVEADYPEDGPDMFGP